MEADWAVDLVSGSPEIIVPWRDESCGSGYVDLRASPATIAALPEVRACPALANALLRLNAADSPVFTSKCDCWNVPAGQLDPYEMDLDPEPPPSCGLACYMDVVHRDRSLFEGFAAQEQWLRAVCVKLHAVPCPGTRVDFVLRRSDCDGLPGYAATIYVTAGGSAAVATLARLSAALSAVVERMVEGQ